MPVDLASHIDRLLLDPWTGKVGFGRRSELIIKLLQKYLAETRQVPAPEPSEEFLSDNPSEVSNRA
jgi:metal-responsive CopG/Arc/MetJ family transcriptional regulator